MGAGGRRNDRTLDEYRELLAAGGGPQVSRPTLCRTLRRLGLRRKKRRCGPASGIGLYPGGARVFRERVRQLDAKDLVFNERPASPQR